MGQLLEMAKREIDGDVTCLDLAPVPAGLQRCRWVGCVAWGEGGWGALGAAGFLWNQGDSRLLRRAAVCAEVACFLAPLPMECF